MKKLKFIFIAAAVLMVGLSACNNERALETDASFTVENIDSLRAGTAVNVIWDGSGEFASIYSGNEGSVWGEEGAKGTSVTGGSVALNYLIAGEYTITMVATSFGNWSTEEVMDVKQQTITIVDDRKEITKFVLTELKMVGAIIGTDIVFEVSDNTDLTALSASWDLSGDDSQVYVNGVEQVEKKTKNDYSNPVIFEVVAPDGSSSNYTVTVNTYSSSTAAEVLTFGMSDHPREAEIDAGAGEIYLYVPYTADLANLKVYGTVSAFAEGAIGTKDLKANGSNHDVSAQPTVVTVTAESGATKDWDLYTAHELAFTEFKFSNLNPEVVGDIDSLNMTVDLTVLEGTDLTDLVADFTLSEAGTVEVGAAEQTSGVTSNDFSAPVTYKLILDGGKTFNYTVTVNTVSK